MARTHKFRKTKVRKTKVRKTKVRKNKCNTLHNRNSKCTRKNLSGSSGKRTLGSDPKETLINELEQMILYGPDASNPVAADAFINKVINTMCPDISSPSKKPREDSSRFGLNGTPLYGPDLTPYDTDIPKADRIAHYDFKPVPYNTDNTDPDILKFRPRNIYDPIVYEK